MYKLLGSVTDNPDGTHYMTSNISQVIQTHNPDSTHYMTFNISQVIQHRFPGHHIFQQAVTRKFSMTSKANFKGTLLFEVKYLRNSTRHRHSCNAVLTCTYTRSYSMVKLRMTLNNQGQLSMTSSVAWPVCNS